MALTGTEVRDRPVVLFDFDGTLADTVGGIIETARTVLRAHGFSDERIGDLRRVVGPPFPQAFSLVYGVSEEEAASITADYRAIYKDLGLAGWPLYDGVEALLRDLKARGRRLAVVSSKRNELVRRAVADEGIGDCFELLLGKASDAEASKAHLVARALEILGAQPGDAVMVGDRRFDVEAAAACGAPCVGVHYGATCETDELVEAGACAVAETVDELRALLLG